MRVENTGAGLYLIVEKVVVGGRAVFALQVRGRGGGGHHPVADHDHRHHQRDDEHDPAHPDDDDRHQVVPQTLNQVPRNGGA